MMDSSFVRSGFDQPAMQHLKMTLFYLHLVSIAANIYYHLPSSLIID